VLDDESLTSANLGNDYGSFGEAQSGQYHTILESRVHLTPRTWNQIDENPYNRDKFTIRWLCDCSTRK